MQIKILITAETEEKNFPEIKRMEHHAEFITENFPELQHIHVEVSAETE